MKNKILLILLALPCFITQLSAQPKYPVTVFNKENYYVYPYRYNEYIPSTFYDIYRFDDVMPVTDSLPDGKFIAFREITNYKHPFLFGRLKVTIDSSKAGAIFSTRGGKRNGPSYWFDEDGCMRVKGNYMNDERCGIWQYFDNKGHMQVEVQMKHGYMDGLYYQFNSKNKYSVVGQFSENKPSGTWHSYYSDGNIYCISNFCPDSSEFTTSALYESYRNYSGWEGNREYMSNIAPSIYLHGMTTIYHDNGQLKKRISYKYGREPRLDTSYYEDGKYNMLSTLISNSGDSVIRYCRKHFDEKGRMTSENISQNDHTLSTKYWDTLGALTTERYYPLFENESKEGKDTLVLSYREYENGKVVYETMILYPSDNWLTRSKSDHGISSDYILGIDSLRNPHVKEYYYTPDSLFVMKIFKSAKEHGEYMYGDSTKIFYDGKPFSGEMKLRYKTRYTKKDKLLFKQNGDKMSVKIISYDRMNQKVGDYLAGIDYEYHDCRSISHFKNGMLDGERKCYNRKHDLINSEHFVNGKLDGERCHYEYGYKDTNHTKKDNILHLESRTFYKSGLRKGENTEYNDYGGISCVSNYADNMYNGKYTSYHENGAVNVSAFYVNDSLEGNYRTLDDKGRLWQDLNYHKDKLDGVSYLYDEGITLPSLEIHCRQGFLVDTSYEYYRNTRQPKKNVYCQLSDSADYNFYHRDVFNEYSDYSYTSSLPNYHGIVTYYYKSGVKSVEGREWKYRTDTIGKSHVVKRSYWDYLGKQDQLWKFWDMSGNFVKLIEYNKMKLPNLLDSTKKDSVSLIGSITEWYGNGMLKSQGYVLDEDVEYNCILENYIYSQEIYYTNYWNYNGEQLIANGNGKLLTYHDNGKLQTLTTIRRGLKDGLYKEWDPDGHLKKLGNYKNGEKDGRWLEGDLEGINYVDEQCFASPEDFENAVRASKKNLDIKEQFYLKGQVLRSNNYRTYSGGFYY